MKFHVKKALTAARVRTQEDAAFILTPVDGNLRLNAGFADALGVPYDEVLTESKDAPGVRIEVAQIEDEKGKLHNLVYLAEAGSKKGAKLASPGKKAAGNLTANHQHVYDTLNGKKGHTTTYGVGATTIGQNEDGSIITVEAAKAAGLLTDEGRYTADAAAQGFCGEDEVGKRAGVGIILEFVGQEFFVPRKKADGTEGDATDVDFEDDDIATDDF